MGIILAIVIFGFIVFFHEFGHFILARKNGITVGEFWIGMGPTIVSKQIGETKYCLKLLPIGGACMMGEDEEEYDLPGSFNSKKPWQRISVIAAGPIFNFILAFICSFVFISFVGYDRPVLGGVLENMPAAEAGLQKGDEILSINGRRTYLFRDISAYNQLHQGEYMELVIQRDGERHTVELATKEDEDGYYYMGIQGSPYEKGTVLDNLKYSMYEVRYWIITTVESVGQLVTGKIGMNQLSGPVGVIDAVDHAYQESRSEGGFLVMLNMLRIAILLSANLGVMNLLPLPALDGGRLVFLFLELIRGKRVPPEKEGYVHLAGMVFLLGLMAVILFNDLKRIFL